MSFTVDMTPTWSVAAQMIAHIMVKGTDEGREDIKSEVLRMGEIIDNQKQSIAELSELVAELRTYLGGATTEHKGTTQ